MFAADSPRVNAASETFVDDVLSCVFSLADASGEGARAMPAPSAQTAVVRRLLTQRSLGFKLLMDENRVKGVFLSDCSGKCTRCLVVRAARV